MNPTKVTTNNITDGLCLMVQNVNQKAFLVWQNFFLQAKADILFLHTMCMI